MLSLTNLQLNASHLNFRISWHMSLGFVCEPRGLDISGVGISCDITTRRILFVNQYRFVAVAVWQDVDVDRCLLRRQCRQQVASSYGRQPVTISWRHVSAATDERGIASNHRVLDITSRFAALTRRWWRQTADVERAVTGQCAWRETGADTTRCWEIARERKAAGFGP